MKRGTYIVMFLLALIGIFFLSCNEQSLDMRNNIGIIEDVQPVVEMNVVENIDWQNQLQHIIDTPPVILKNSGIVLLGYTLIDHIDSDSKMLKVREKLKSEENMIPTYSTDLKSVRAITKSEAKRLSNNAQRYTFMACEKYIDDNIMMGMKVLSLKWNNKGVETETFCVVSDKKGIVYDNFLINTFIVDEPTITVVAVTTNNGVEEKVYESFSNGGEPDIMPMFSGFVNWIASGSAKWLWGSERGSATISHTGHYNYDSFLRHDYYARHYFQIGNSDAQVREIARNMIAYGYGFSTPMVTINLTFANGMFSLSFSGIGTTSGETGAHSHPLTYRE